MRHRSRPGLGLASVSAILGLCVLVSPGAGAPIDLSFPKPTRFPEGLDYDGDGIPDRMSVQYVQYGDCYLIWSKGRPDSTFEPPVSVPVPLTHGYESLGLLGAVDLNDDGLPEVLLTDACFTCNCPTRDLLVLINNGPPHFLAPLVSSIGENPRLRAPDADGDGDVDLISMETTGDCGSRYPGVRVHLNDGTGRIARTYYVVVENGPVAVADFTGDGFPDIVAPESARFYPGGSNGQFGTPRALPAGSIANPAAFALERDLDLDGDVDVLYASEQLTHVLTNDGSGAFTHSSYPVGAQSPPVTVDLDADDDDDYAFSWDQSLVLLHHVGDDRFDWSIVPTENAMTTVVTGEINADGLPDFLDYGPTSFSALTSLGIGAYQRGPRYDASIGTVFLDDLEPDGAAEVLFRGDCGDKFLPGVGNGEFVAPLWRDNIPYAYGRILLTDIDGDQVRDAVGFAGRGFGWSRDQGDAMYGPLRSVTWAELVNPRAIQVADLDGNGTNDVVVARSSTSGVGDVAVFLNRGGGDFADPVYVAQGTNPTALLVGDFDDDGNQDIVTNGWSSFVVVLRGLGDGSFQTPLYSEADTPGALAVFDEGDDALSDLAVHVDGGVRLLHNQGGGQFASTTLVPTPVGFASDPLHVLDLDRDGHLDLLVVGGTEFQLLRGNAGGGFDAPLTGAPGRGDIVDVVAGDFDADGQSEVVALTADHKMGVFAEQVGGSQRVLETCVVDALAVADLTGDGKPDLLTPNALYVNRTDTPTAILVSDLSAWQEGERVHLQWSVAPSALGALRGMDIERRDTTDGWFGALNAQPLVPDVHMSWIDDLGAAAEVEYRVVSITATGERYATPAVRVRAAATGRLTRLESIVNRPDGNIEVRYRIASDKQRTEWSIVDVRGRLVAALPATTETSGVHLRVLSVRGASGEPLARGVYWLTLRAGRSTDARSFVLLHHPR